jgi:hypothetical protein
MPDTPKFDFREWLVPPVLLPILLWPADRGSGGPSAIIHLKLSCGSEICTHGRQHDKYSNY